MKTAEKKRIALIWALIAIMALVSFYFDPTIVKAVASIRTGILTNFFMGITFASSILIVFLFLTLLFIKERKRKWILPLWLSLAATIGVTALLKFTVQRLRPYQVNLVPILQGISTAGQTVWDFSFPSLQSAFAFAAIPFLSKEFPKFKYVWVIFACLVAFSRVYVGVHFLSDVIIGGAIGYLISFFIMKWWTEKYKFY